MEKLTCIMDCKKETQAVRFLSKCAIVYSAIAGIISFVGTILSIISATESRADSFSEILYAFLPTIIACGICFALALLFLALSSILHALTTSARIAELRATRDGVPYTDVYNTIRTKSTPQYIKLLPTSQHLHRRVLAAGFAPNAEREAQADSAEPAERNHLSKMLVAAAVSKRNLENIYIIHT